MRFATFTSVVTRLPYLVAVDRIVDVSTNDIGVTYITVRYQRRADKVLIAGTVEQAMAALDHAKRTFTMFGWVTDNGGREVFIGTPERAKEAAKYGKVIPVYTMEEDDA